MGLFSVGTQFQKDRMEFIVNKFYRKKWVGMVIYRVR